MRGPDVKNGAGEARTGGRAARAKAAAEAVPAGGSVAAATPGGGATAWPAFWLPAGLRERLIGDETVWQEARFARGRLCGGEYPADAPGAVTARWPSFSHEEWAELVSELRAAREKAPRGPEYWERLQAALGAAAGRLADPSDPTHAEVVAALSGYTGYSPGMISAALTGPDLWHLEKLTHALRYQPNKACGVRWRSVPGLQGRIRFFPSKPLDKVAGWIPVAYEMPLFATDTRPEAVVGFAAGDVPGSALMLIFLALSTTLRGEAPLPRHAPPPVVVARNSPCEPILTPLVLAAIEQADPELVSTVATNIWNQEDALLQHQILGEADLVVAAAGDSGISRLAGQTAAVRSAPRLHHHGPKVGFTVISREVLEVMPIMDAGGRAQPGGVETIDVVALLAGLESAFWDQNSCNSSRLHFVEKGGLADDLPAEYARRLTKRLRQIAEVMPRGAWPLRHLHDPFDRYHAIEGSDRWGNGLHVVSEYEDPFVVVLDDRTSKESRLDHNVFASMVEECRTRVIIVRPVNDVMEVPWYYLDMLPRDSLQSLSVAFGRPGQGMTKRVLDFATACGLRGVTTIRTVGRGAFAHVAYSWDGLVPLDLVGGRPPGHFTTIEFDAPFEDLMRTYRAHVSRLARLPPSDKGGPVTPV